MQDGRSFITASPTPYGGEDAVVAKVNTTILVLTPCMTEGFAGITAIPSCIAEGIAVIRVSNLWHFDLLAKYELIARVVNFPELWLARTVGF